MSEEQQSRVVEEDHSQKPVVENSVDNTVHLSDQSATTIVTLDSVIATTTTTSDTTTINSEPISSTITSSPAAVATTTTTTINGTESTIPTESSNITSEQVKKGVEDIAIKIALERANLRKEQSAKKQSSIIDVTKSNFDEKFKEIQELLPKTAFISFDLEMTGLEVDEEHKLVYIDTIEDRYLKLKDSVKSFEVIQVGLCLWFVKDVVEEQPTEPMEDDENIDQAERLRRLIKSSMSKKTTTTVTAKPYNFYVFKSPTRSANVFSCQNTCLEFLVNNKMDLNKVIGQGISYMNEEEEEATRENVARIAKQKASANNRRKSDRGDRIQIENLKPEQREFLENCKSRVAEWFDNSDENDINLDPCNTFERKLLFQEFGEIYENKVTLTTVYSNNRTAYIRVLRATGESEEEKMQREIREAVDRDIGFSRIIRELKKHKHLFFIGHNAMLDMMHIVHKFIKPLPESSEEFKAIVRENFEHVIDTKYICETYPQISSALARDTSLRTAFEYTLNNNNTDGPIFENFTEFYSSVKDFDHVAAFDAFMTGYVFFRISHIIATNRNKNFKGIADLTHIKEMTNIINIHNCDLNLKLLKPNPTEDRSDVFLLTNLTQEITNEHIKDAFSKYGMIKIFWINAKYCWVKLSNRASVLTCNRDVMNQMACNNQGMKTLAFEKGVTIMTYVQAQQGKILPTISHLASLVPLAMEDESSKKRKNEEIKEQTTEPTQNVASSSPSQNSNPKRVRRSSGVPATSVEPQKASSCNIL